MVSSRHFLLATSAAIVSSSADAARAGRGQNNNNNNDLPQALAIYRTDMSDKSFIHMPEASAYKGSPVKFDYWFSTSADQDLDFLHHVKPVVMRLYDSGIAFTPKMMVAEGSADHIQCLNHDGSPNPNAPRGCGFECTNSNRYCDAGAFDEGKLRARHHRGINGNRYVKESARMQCIWEKYGKKKEYQNLYNYFQYQDSLHATNCNLEDACVEQAMKSVDFDFNMIEECHGDIGPGVDKQNYVLEDIIETDQPVEMVPALVINGKEETDFEEYVQKKQGHNVKSILGMVCDAMGDKSNKDKPPVCDFCLNYCPNKVGAAAFDMNTCLWELKCGDKAGTGYAQYAKEYGMSSTSSSSSSSTGASAGSAASNPAILTGAEQQQSSGSSHSSVAATAASEGLGILATMLAVVLSAGFAALAVMAIRVWRTKMIIDRYVKEQQAMNDAQQNGMGAYGHRDPTFFPEDSAELDLDLEPALQYSDHINAANGRASPPGAASFLPQLT